MMYTKILVPVDGSPTSICGLHEAVKLAKQLGATLRLVHVVDEFLLDSEYRRDFSYDAHCKAVRESGRRTLVKMLAIAHRDGIEADSALLETFAGRTADLIVDAARAWPADLIVMGTHGRRGLKRLLMGSDASLVLQSAEVPVLLIRSPSQDAEVATPPEIPMNG